MPKNKKPGYPQKRNYEPIIKKDRKKAEVNYNSSHIPGDI
jgi:hypothetical protein